MLNYEANTPEPEDMILSAAYSALDPTSPQPRRLSAAFNDGQWWVTDLNTGAQWSVHGVDPGPFSFEQVTQGNDA